MVAHHDLFKFGFWVTVQHIVRGLIVGDGAFQVMNGRATIGDLLAFIAYVPDLYEPMRRTLNMNIETESIKAFAESIDELMTRRREDTSGGNHIPNSAHGGATVEFSFGMGEKVLESRV